jgi:hypothetical protein
MPSILTNPGALVAICLVAVIVIGVNLTLLSVLRRNSRGESEANKWLRAFGGAPASRLHQDAQLEELHRAVSQLPAVPATSESAHE